MTRLSNRQFPMMQAFLDLRGGYMTIDEARTYDQRALRSMLIRKYVAYHAGRGFYFTKDGKNAWEEFGDTDIRRKHPELPLTAYFDANAYGLAKPKTRTRAA